MAVYNTSYMENATNILDLMIGIGTSTGNPFLLGNLILLGFFLIFMIFAIRWDFNEVLIVDSFLTSILAILLYIAGLVSAPIIAYPVVILAITLVFTLFNK